MAVREITGGTESAVKFGGIDRSNGTPLGCWQELYGMDFTAFPALKTVKPFSYKALADGITGYIIKNGEIVYTKADGIYISGVKTAVNLSAGEKQLVSLGAYDTDNAGRGACKYRRHACKRAVYGKAGAFRYTVRI